MTEDEFWAAMAPRPIPPDPFFRLYYDEQGYPLFYSMEDLPGNYIEIDQAIWTNPGAVRVIDGKLTWIKKSLVHKLVPGNVGTACHPGDVAVVVDDAKSNIKWSVK
jgi:hypothetical protein